MSHQPPTLTLTEGTRPGSGSPLVRGATLGRYVVLDLLGCGGMGVVYAAYDFGLDRRICLKLVRHAGGERSAERQERLLREARAAARVSHPHVVTVHDVGTWEEHVFVAMELVEGGTLRRWLRSAQRSRAEILDAFVQAGRGLAAAHAAGLVHRDFKPDNVLVGDDGRVRVTDFGLARDAEAPSPLDAGHTSGTPAYMAPEQHRGEPASAASDQFSFALALYEALYHCSPYAASNPEELRAFKSLGRFAPQPARSKVPGWLRAALLRALSAERPARHPSMQALLGALQAPPRS
ncbi:MAG: serine/threonine protein kinase, partial [Myxococcota bacterium]|nr:serine/threonine protein kinase [Myxococcota bacterium]